ncbi:hypothetical protein Tco_1325309, partial [Tanacetum coccineum]
THQTRPKSTLLKVTVAGIEDEAVDENEDYEKRLLSSS